MDSELSGGAHPPFYVGEFKKKFKEMENCGFVLREPEVSQEVCWAGWWE